MPAKNAHVPLSAPRFVKNLRLRLKPTVVESPARNSRLPIARRNESKKKSMPRKRKSRPKPVSPTPISAHTHTHREREREREKERETHSHQKRFT